MKKIIYTFFVLLGLSSISFAQEANEIAVSKGQTELVNSKRDGVYQFTFVDQTTERIEKSANYYTHYFTVEYDETTGNATITMVENTDKSRSVIMRFLTSAGARYVKIGENVISTSEFMVDYL